MPRLVTTLPSVPENPEEFYNFTFVYRLGKKIGEENGGQLKNASKMSSYIWRKLEAPETEVLEEDLYAYAQELNIPVPIIIGSIHATSPAKVKKRHSVSSDQVDLSTISKVEGRLVGIASTTDSDKKAHRYLYLRCGRRIKAFKVHLPSDPRPETYVSHDYRPSPGYIGLGSTRHYLNITKG